MRFDPSQREIAGDEILMEIRSARMIRNTLLLAAFVVACDASGAQRVFDAPDAAVDALLEALAADDIDEIGRIFGPEFEEYLLEGDREDSKHARAVISEHAERGGTRLSEVSENRQILLIGALDWPFPMPLVRDTDAWRFDTAEGLEEMADRRVGGNEGNAIAIARVYAEAQEEYASKDRDGDLVREYAQRLISTPGQRDGLFWPVDEGSDDELSPFGPLIAEAREVQPGRERGDPFKGYFFKILTRQGPNPPGGEFDYIINGNMIAGFALVAFPAEYEKSGVMTFVVSHQGTVFQKDLGPFPGMDRYDPDSSWSVVAE
jgi:hypothetical protein